MAEAFPYDISSSIGDDSINNDGVTVNYVALSTQKRVYKTRWYVLLLYGLLGTLQGFVWNMWGPIYDSMNFVYGWTSRQLALLPFYGALLFLVLVLPSAFFLERFGLRKLMIFMSSLIAISALVKCIPAPDDALTALVNVSAILNGIAGSCVFFVPAFISANWFPTDERKLATAIGTLLNGLGVALAFVVGPAFVDEPDSGVPAETMRHQYLTYTYILAAIAVILLLTILSYYPNKPPLPPTDSALVKRLHFGPGFKMMLQNKSYWCLCVSSVLLLGVFAGWGPVLVLDLGRQGIDEDHAGYVGFYSAIAGVLAGLVVSKMADKFQNLKAILIGLTVLSIEASIWLLLTLHGYVTFSLRSVYVASIIGAISTGSSWSIRFELAAELCYPVDEALSVGFLGLVINIIVSLFLSLLFFPQLGIVWIDYALVCGSLLSLPCLLAVKETYKRSDADVPDN